MNKAPLLTLAAVVLLGLIIARRITRMNGREIIKEHEGWSAAISR